MTNQRIGIHNSVIFAVALAVTLTPLASATGSGTGFYSKVSRIPPRVKDTMRGNSWHEGCPVALRDLRLVRLSYHGFDGVRHVGRVVVNEDATSAVVAAFRAMWRKHFKIHRMRLVDHYDSKDRRSMRHDNTSAFNCRNVAGTTRWSEHAYGRAIDINPVENPYVGSDGSVSPKKGEPYADRSQHAKGMVHEDGVTVRAFARQAWGWGGSWSSPKDYQHFSASGG